MSHKFFYSSCTKFKITENVFQKIDIRWITSKLMVKSEFNTSTSDGDILNRLR